MKDMPTIITRMHITVITTHTPHVMGTIIATADAGTTVTGINFRPVSLHLRRALPYAGR